MGNTQTHSSWRQAASVLLAMTLVMVIPFVRTQFEGN